MSSNRNVVLCVALAYLFILPGVVTAQPPTYSEPSGLSLTCYAPHAATGQVVPVRGMNGNAGGFWGFATYDHSGWPTIIFDVAQLIRLPFIVTRFTYYHECAHLTIPTKDEVVANCVGLKNMRRAGHIDRQGEATIGRVMNSLPYLPPQYGGSGGAYWQATLQCAGD